MNQLNYYVDVIDLSNAKAKDLAIIELIEQLADSVAAQGYSVKPYTRKSLLTLAAWPLEKKEDLFKKLSAMNRIIASATETERIDPSVEHPEKRFIEQALNFYNLEIKDNDFWKKLGKNELIEIYNRENIQIFRTFNFFLTSSYSLLDLLVHEWYNLWERPTSTIDQMFNIVKSVLAGSVQKPTPANVPEHIISEIFNAEDQEQFISRSSLCKFGIICPIYDKVSGEVGGLIVSAQVTPVALGTHAKKISFI